MVSKSKPAEEGVAVTTSDTVNLVSPARALWVGVKGNVSVEMIGLGTAIVFVGAQGLLPVSVTRVNATLTTATNIVALR